MPPIHTFLAIALAGVVQSAAIAESSPKDLRTTVLDSLASPAAKQEIERSGDQFPALAKLACNWASPEGYVVELRKTFSVHSEEAWTRVWHTVFELSDEDSICE